MMRDDSNTGSCGSGTCCVEVDDGEMRLLHLGESISAKDPCLTYTCTVRYVSVRTKVSSEILYDFGFFPVKFS